MHLASIFGAAGLLHAVVHAIPAPHTYVLHEKRNTAYSSIVKRSRVSPDAILPVRIGLSQRDLHKGHDYLMDVSHPSSPNFGKHWTAEEVNKAFAPEAETVRAVREWLLSAGIASERISLSDNHGWLAFDASVEEAEQLFHAEFHEQFHEASGKYMVGCEEYYIPAQLQKHIDYIKPGVKATALRKRDVVTGKRWPKSPKAPWGSWQPKSPHNPHMPKNPSSNSLANCSTWITPPCVKALYDIFDNFHGWGRVNSSNSLGVFEEWDTYSQLDLDQYFGNFTPWIPKGTHPILNAIDGAVAPVPQADAGGESMLDLSIIYSLIYPQTITLYQTDDPHWAYESLNGGSAGFFDTFLDALDGSFCTYSAFGQTGNNNTVDPIYPDPAADGYKGPLQCGKYTPTNVISVSYLEAEYDLPVNYQQRQCNEFMKLGLQGHSILFCSGDYGVGGFPYDNNPNGCLGSGNIFSPAGPSTCPYVTSVGATALKPNTSVLASNPEEAVSMYFGDGYLFTSGGGFSNIYAIPDYQKSAVAGYFAGDKNPPYKYYETLKGVDIGANGGVYNRIGRGFPDVSANGGWWLDIWEGELGGWGGTSMSTPIWASLINKIVEARLAAGKGPIGFLNPTLYTNPGVLNDITEGSNSGCGTDGFAAAKGWDPVTGLGTPNFPKLMKLFMSLP